MFYYFSSEYPSAIKVNGVYFGLIEQTLKKIDSQNDLDFVEVCPINCTEPTVNFLLNQDFFNNPPPNTSVTDLKGGYLINFKKSYLNGEFKVVSQKNYGDLLVTVFNENGMKISLETKLDFFAEPVCTDSQIIEFFRPNFNKNLVAIAFNDKKTMLSIYDITEKINKVYFGSIDEFSFDNAFCTTEKFSDIAKHKLNVTWDYDGNEFKEHSRTIARADNFCVDTLPERVLPYAFLEEFLLKGDISCYLDSCILDNANKLNGFFGDFLGVMPPPTFRDFNEVGLIYRKRDNSYFVNYFTFGLKDRKICSIKKID